MKIFYFYIFVSSFFCLAEEGDENFMEEVETPSQVSPQQGAMISKGEVIEDKEHFDFTKLLEWRDPFQKPIRVIENNAKPSSPLEMYAVGEFKFLGVVTGPKKLKAMLQAPDGKSYFISIGDKIGQRGGKVRNISINTLTVIETIENVLGQKENLETKLALPVNGDQISNSPDSSET